MCVGVAWICNITAKQYRIKYGSYSVHVLNNTVMKIPNGDLYQKKKEEAFMYLKITLKFPCKWTVNY